MNKLIWTSTLALAALGTVPAQAADADSVMLADLQEVVVKGVRA